MSETGETISKIRVSIPVIVEGKYDKAHLSSIIDALIIPTNGFGVFKNEEKRALIRRLGQRGVIILCDSDGGGKVIRSHLKGTLGGITVYDLYTPQVEGKERRKEKSSKEGYLGVEGIDSDVLRGIFLRFAEAHPELCGGSGASVDSAVSGSSGGGEITKSLLYELGLSGGEGSSILRDRLCEKLGLPRGMNANALHSALCMISDAGELCELMREVH